MRAESVVPIPAATTFLSVLLLLTTAGGAGWTQPSPVHAAQRVTLAQDSTRPAGPPAQHLSLDLRQAPLTEALAALKQRADLEFVYSPDLVPTDTSVSVQVEGAPVEEALRAVLGAVGLTYRVSEGGHVVLAAQKPRPKPQGGTITGVVTDASTGEALPGANVSVADTDQGGATDQEGQFRIENVPPGRQVLVVSFVGYQSNRVEVTVQEGETVTQDILLQPRPLVQDGVVVTALNIERQEQSLGYSVQEVDGADLARVRETNVVNSLAGRVAGARITNASGGVGASSRIVIRGENTLGDNQPLFVIDGVPVDNSNLKSSTGTFDTDAGGSQSAIDFGNAIADLNPDDIASISVLKGPSAAALYGSRAANGVVLVETKSGYAGGGLGIEVNSSLMAQSILELPNYQNQYGQGARRDTFVFIDGSTGDGGDGLSYGPPLDEGLEFVQFHSDGEPAPWDSRPNNVRNFFETGLTAMNNIAFRGGTRDFNYRLSYTNMSQSGIVPNTDLGRHTLSLNTGFDITDRLRGSVAANYVRTSSDNRMGGGYDDQNVMKQFSWFGRQVEVEALRPYAEGNELNWNTRFNENPYFTVRHNTNGLLRDRVFGATTLSYDLTSWLDVQARAGLDRYSEMREIRRANNGYEFPNGAYTREHFDVTELNTDVLVTARRELGADLSVELSGGANRMRRTFENDLLRARELAVPNTFNMSNARGIPVANNRIEEKQINSLYGLAEFSYRDALFLNVTGRNDWSSTLPQDNNSYFYPSISMGAVLSDVIDLGDPVSFVKVRASWSQVGSDAEPYQLNLKYASGADNWGSTTTVTVPNTLPNSDLKPEITSSIELGADLRFFGDRLGVDVTYYDNQTENQIIRGSIASETGFSREVFNAGKITNKGWEVTVNATPINQTDGLRWDVVANYNRNRNEVVELAEGVDELRLPAGRLFRLNVVAKEGEPYGTFMGREMRRTPDGEIIFGADGLPELTDEFKVQGNYQPDWTGGIENSLSYRGLRLSVLVDGRIGGEIYSGTNVILRRAGTGASTLRGRENGIVGDGVVENEDGTFSPNETRVSAQEWYLNYYGYNNTEVSVFDGSYVKLREVSLSYRLPSPWAQSLAARNITLSAIGRNLAILHKNVPNIDPETAVASDVAQGIEFGQIPSTRSLGMKVSLSF
jgi:TonB-linked SusC/RagA family outer membrane protein